MNADELRELIPLAALDALDVDEMAEFTAAIADHPDLQRELDEMRRAAASLALAEATPPPPGLRDAVLAEISGTEQLPPAPPAAPSPPDNVVPLRRRWILAAAAAVLAVVVGIGAWIAIDSTSDEQDLAAEILDSDDAQTIPLEGAIDGVQVVYSPSVGDAALTADAMPEIDEDRTYQLWYVDDTGPQSAGVFRPDDDGEVRFVIEDFRPGVVLAVTDEPAGGSDLPTTDILVASA